MPIAACNCRPTSGPKFVLADSLPSNTNGKVLARDLRERLERQL